MTCKKGRVEVKLRAKVREARREKIVMVLVDEEMWVKVNLCKATPLKMVLIPSVLPVSSKRRVYLYLTQTPKIVGGRTRRDEKQARIRNDGQRGFELRRQHRGGA
ncbi:hypothetical protein FOPE_06580 [Fonsecaea pedrosoi]|nr:hypothetical protein FOPE_06580 [Fonsecaea pedrosoi]